MERGISALFEQQEREMAQRKSVEKRIKIKWRLEITIAEENIWNSFQ